MGIISSHKETSSMTCVCFFMNHIGIASVCFPKGGAWGQLVFQPWLFGGIAPCLAGAIVLQTSFPLWFLPVPWRLTLLSICFCLQSVQFKTTSLLPPPAPSVANLSTHSHRRGLRCSSINIIVLPGAVSLCSVSLSEVYGLKSN